jgi:aminoglycoside phosphotransferase (APT) family kinase protein
VDMIDPDDDLVRALLRDQHPDLAERELVPVEGGWDNRMWRLGEDLAVRVPRTPRAPCLLTSERRWLPQLAPHLPLPIPTPVRVGEPSPRFPMTWTVVTWVAGEPADRSPITRADTAETLGRFLRALHQPAPDDAPTNATRGVPLQALEEDFDTWWPALEEDEDVEALRKVWEQALSAPAWEAPPVWLHGDLHPANVVVTDGALSGVIDFGELCSGDPATDLAAAWVLLPDGASAAFIDAYAGERGLAAATIRRALGWAAIRAVHLIGIGRNGDLGLPGGKKSWGPAGRAALRRVLTSADAAGHQRQ